MSTTTPIISGLSRDAEAMKDLVDGIKSSFGRFEYNAGLPEGAANWYEAAVDVVAARLAPQIADQLEAALADELAERRMLEAL